MAHSSPRIPETSAHSIPQARAEMPQPIEPAEKTPPENTYYSQSSHTTTNRRTTQAQTQFLPQLGSTRQIGTNVIWLE